MHSVVIRVFAAVLVVSLWSACSLLSPAVAPKVANAVAKYCREPQAERVLIRAQVNDMIRPNSIRVTCAADPPETPTPAAR